MKVIIAILLVSSSVQAELWLPSIFGSGMVLQSGKPVPVWGEAEPGAEVTVEFAGQKKTTVADSSRHWVVVLDPLAVSSKPRRMTVSSTSDTPALQYSNLLVGEVWILAGQSNMGWPLSKCDGGPDAAAKADYPWLRIFRQWPNQGACDNPARDVTGGQWVVCTPQQAAQLSGVGFFFARALQKSLPAGTPIALINTQMGGTYAECWIDSQTLEKTPSARPYLDKAAKEVKPGEFDPKGYWGKNNFRRPSALYNGKVAPLQPFAVRGVIWYQGEGNSQKWLAPGYAGTLTALIESWRSGFGQPELPFLIVQLPHFNAGPGSDWPAVRAAQAQVAHDLPGVEMVVTLDCGRDDQIHPPDKQPIGERLARKAQETVYGKEPREHVSGKPNIIIILADDSGYSDLGCYGGEIDTPNIDRLARNGLRFRNFYNNGRCSPTRASLMTGRDSAYAGFGAGTLGGWNREMKQPAYRARLPYDLPTIAELMEASGYQTMMAGKWHLGGSLMKNEPNCQTQWKRTHPGWELTPEEIEADFNALPAQRGFGKFFGLIEGETHQFFIPGDKHDYLEGNKHAKLRYDRTYNMHCFYKKEGCYPYTPNNGKTAKAFYGTDGMTDRAIEMIREAAQDPRPFFLYMAYRAPHLPLQAPQELVDKYLPRYADLAKVETDRIDGLVREGLWSAGTGYRKYFSGGRTLPPGKAGDYRLRLALHAAMVEKIDDNVGRVVQTLEQLGELDNTLVFYLSDNGAASHVGEMMNKPYFGCKALMWEGGTKTHCIAYWPKVIPPGTITDSIGWVGDLLPTCLEVAGGTYPSEFRGTKTAPLDGRSILPILKGYKMDAPEYLFSNDKGQQGVVCRGRWKLLIEPGWYVLTSKKPGTEYELYDLENDPAETKNLAKQNPERVAQLAAACVAWQKRCGIIDYAKILAIRPDHTK